MVDRSYMWLPAKVHEYGLGCGVDWTPALSVMHSATELVYVPVGAI